MRAEKLYIATFLVALMAGVALSATLAYLDISTSDSDDIRLYQQSKLKSRPMEGIELAVVGDSSAGNAIDAQELSRISHMKSVNLALTGTYGLIGPLNMIKKAHKRWGTSNFLIIQSLDIWHRDIEPQAIFKTQFGAELGDYAPLFQRNIYLEYFEFLINPRRIFLAAGARLKTNANINDNELGEVDLAHDFLMQRNATYANGGLAAPTYTIKSTVSNEKKHELALLDDYCDAMKLNCVLAPGPIHETVYLNSANSIQTILQFLDASTHAIRVSKQILSLPGSQLGDTIDHVTHAIKPRTTQHYWSIASSSFTAFSLAQ